MIEQIHSTSDAGKRPLENLSLEQYLINVLGNKNAQNIISIDLDGKSDLADSIIIATGSNTTHVSALADHIVSAFKQTGREILSVAGKSNSRWVIVDNAEIIVHIFHPEEREIYNLEKMWSMGEADEKNMEILH